MKSCSKCQEIKELAEFARDRRLKDGYRSECKSCKSKLDLEYKTRTKDKQKLKNQEYYQSNREVIYRKSQAYKKSRPEKTRQYGRDWEKRNRASRTEAFARYRARKKQAAINYEINKEEIKQIYLNCPKGMHVDHIIPLAGDNVCGLHVPCNLQYLTREENSRKGNRCQQ